MQPEPRRLTHPARTNGWLWLIPLLLLLCLLVLPRLNWDGLWYDEVYSVINSGGVHFGPLSPLGIYQQVLTDDPHQALGYPYMLAAWGAFAGWTEFAGRYLSLLWALLMMAVTYRLGVSSSGSVRVGLLAALIVGVSSFVIYYAHELRAFTYAGFSAALLMICYWRMVTAPQRVGWGVKVGYVLGAAGLFYAHYFAGILAVGVGLYHLLFVKKDRHWPLAALLGIVVVILFLPQIPPFLAGFDRYDPQQIEKAPLTAVQILEHLLYYIGNGAGLVLAVIGLLAGIGAAAENRRGLRMIVGVTLLSLAVLIVLNEWLDILEPSRLRYAIFLWPPLAIWIAAGFDWLAGVIVGFLRGDRKRHPALRAALITLVALVWIGNALRVHTIAGFNDSIQNDYVPHFRTVTDAMRDVGMSGDDIFVFYHATNQDAWHIRDSFSYGTHALPMQAIFASNLYDTQESTAQWARGQVAGAERVWFGINYVIGFDENYEQFSALLDEQFTLCQTYVEREDIGLQLWARSTAFCPTDTPLMRFGDGITLWDAETTQSADTLSLAFGWSMTDAVPPDTYSLAVHLSPQDDPTRIPVQADSGLTVAPFDAVRADLDLSTLDSGTYTVWLVVYDYRSGARLPAVRFDDGTQADRVPLLDITVE